MIVLGIVLTAFVVVLVTSLYLCRWNIFNPNKNSSVEIGGLKRTFIYHLPKKLGSNPRLIIVYHGSKMNAFLMQVFTGHEFDVLADANQNTIIVYPQGYKNNWNDCRKEAPFPAKRLNVDDVAFTGKIIYFFEKNYNVSKTDIFAVGFSNGGQMVLKLARQKPDWFKGFAVLNANIPTNSNNDCGDTKKPASILLINGINDTINPYDGGEVILDGKSFGAVISAEQHLNYWLDVNNCNRRKIITVNFPQNPPDKIITAIQENYYSFTNDKQVSFVKILDGGHTIPNRNFRIPIKKMGKMNKDVDAPKVIWDFFDQIG